MPTNDARLPRRATRKPAAGQMTVAPVSQLRRWVNRGLLVTGVGLVSAGIYQGGTHLSAQQVERLTVMGDVQHIDIEAIQSRLAPRVAAGFLATDLTDLRHELESLPWIYRVNTRRRWPAEIEVTLTEQRPLTASPLESAFMSKSTLFPTSWESTVKVVNPPNVLSGSSKKRRTTSTSEPQNTPVPIGCLTWKTFRRSSSVDPVPPRIS